MRIREILQEDYNASLQSDVDNLLVGVKGSGSTEIQTGALAQQLSNMGYAVDVNSLMTLLSQNPMVMNVTPDMVTLDSPEASSSNMGDDGQDSEQRVSDMAQDASEIG